MTNTQTQTNTAITNKGFYLLLSILFTLPIPLGSNQAWAWSFFEVAIFMLTIYVVVSGLRRKHLGFAQYKNAVCLWLALLAICALQIVPLPSAVVAILSPTSFELFESVAAKYYFLSVDPGQTLVSFIKVVSFFCLFICILNLIDSHRRIRLLLVTVIAAGTFQAVYGTLEILLGASKSLIFELKVEDVATGTFDYSNHYANFLMISLAAAFGLIVTSFEQSIQSTQQKEMQSIEDKILNSTLLIKVCITIMLIGLFMSGSRMGNAAVYVGVVIVGLLALLLIKNPSKSIKSLVVNMGILNLFIISAYFGIGQIKQKLTPISQSEATANDIAQDAYPMVADFPIFGSGGGSFYSTFPSYQHMEVGTFYNHMQNDYLQFLIEYGVIGSFILVAIFALSMYKAIEAFNSRRSSIFKGTAFACAMVFVGMAMHMSVDYPLQGYAIACYFVVFLALSIVINTIKLAPTKNRLGTQ